MVTSNLREAGYEADRWRGRKVSATSEIYKTKNNTFQLFII